ncbi:hypothetical protein WICANDRAFT_84355 [Wickerhamomyces anomalus NRRL Y-366-8]|uniref:Major facilitator superfamily (MFS) profile domain-containing protein n=1 Tax=Wickerhamomyces anomalus (strain ATCC 58044 / CBS 1984 / NCYC 433 / NRRL Y-366-8) TaxID=683960 RepID=A0A1E3NZB3_WICAA|nr:uncharacterized protein WICANDRAFT_84355 [Wickerhamomyces anomalus NRRL Y-366-8]ODQ58556.1 hypothetical protein WICANDRAFT_84355 [Wickerhamomyces anomalus NRRL Y-366-8]
MTEEKVANEIQLAVRSTGFLTYSEERKLLRRVDLRLMPLLILLYLCKNLDVNNISYVTTMNKGTHHNVLTELKMTKDDWSWTSTIYFIPFVIFEIPSTIMMKKSTPKVHLFRIAFLWGAVTACQAAVKNKAGLYALRFLLGAAEAGMYPGMLSLLCFWYRPDEITTRMAFLGVLGSFSNILTAFITYGFSFASGRGGLSGWQWVFLIEGIFTVLCSFLILFYLPNYPDSAINWLEEEEKAYLLARLPPQAPKSTDANLSLPDIKKALQLSTTWAFSFLKLFQSLGTYGLAFWLPSIIQDSSSTNCTSSKAYFPPGYLVFASLVVSLISFIILTTVQLKPVLYAFIIIATLSSAADGSVLSSWMTHTLEGSSQIGFAFAFSNSLAQLGGIIGPQIFRARYAPRYTVPYAVCLTFIGLAMIIVTFIWLKTKNVTYKLMRERRQRLKERSVDPNEKPVYNHEVSELTEFK